MTRPGPPRIALEAALLAAVIASLATWRYPVGPRVLLGVMYAVASSRMFLPQSRAAEGLWMAAMSAATASLAAAQWWHGEPARLRVAGAVFYAVFAVVCAVVYTAWDVTPLPLRGKEPAS